VDMADQVSLPFPSRQDRDLPLSFGSETHGSGECKPCAWFHRPGGCSNGPECQHCHLCPENAIKERRKLKQTRMRRELSTPTSEQVDFDVTPHFSDALWAVQQHQQEALLLASIQAQAFWMAAASPFGMIAAQFAAASSSFEVSPFGPAATQLLSAASPLNCGASPLGAAPLSFQIAQQELPVDSPCSVDDSPWAGDLSSKGSGLHFTGMCKPCAWFWKPKGCQNGKDCDHCHFCPEGALKERRKTKEAALRMGMLEQRPTGLDALPALLDPSPSETASSSGAPDKSPERSPRVG